VKKINIDMSQFELSKDDIKQMRSIDKKTLSSPNYKKNKRVDLEYYAEDELEDVGTDDYSDCDGREELETLGDAGMDIY